jgi:hypothetical protein
MSEWLLGADAPLVASFALSLSSGEQPLILREAQMVCEWKRDDAPFTAAIGF